MKRTLVTSFAMLSALVLSLAVAQDTQETAGDIAAVRVVHFAAGVSEVDILIGGEVTFQGVAARTASGYLFVPAGDYDLEVVSIGAPAIPADETQQPAQPAQPDQPAQPAQPAEVALPVTASIPITLEADSYHTVVVVDAAQEAQGLELQVITDTFADLPSASQALVRIVHASPDATPADIVAARSEAQESQQATQEAQTQEGQEQEGPQPIQGQTLASNLAYTEASDYMTVPAGDYHLQVREVDTDTVTIDLPDASFEPGVVYTLYISGSDASNSLSIDLTVDALIAREVR